MHSANSDTLRMTAKRVMRDGKSRVSMGQPLYHLRAFAGLGLPSALMPGARPAGRRPAAPGECAAKTAVSCKAVLWHEPCTVAARQEEARARGRNAFHFSP